MRSPPSSRSSPTGAEPMRWFGAACLWLQHVSHRTHIIWLQFIVLFLSVPCFEISHFCFKRAYAISLRRIRLAGLDSILESIQDDTLKLNGLGLAMKASFGISGAVNVGTPFLRH